MLHTTSSLALSAPSLFDLIADAPGQLIRIKRTMIDISHAIEETAGKATGGYLFAGFQRFSLFAKEIERYTQLSRDLQHCWIFGVADAALPDLPNITPVALDPSHPLVNEWFVIADGPAFGSALLSADISGFAIADRSRQFMGLWSADTTLIRAATLRLVMALDAPAPTWTIDCCSTLNGYDQMSNNLLAVYEERFQTLRH